jgi:hypothetical protein
MIGSGVDLIIYIMTINNMFKKLDKGKAVVMGLSKAEICENKIEGTGQFGSGNKSGKISRFKKQINGPVFLKTLSILEWIWGNELWEFSTKKKKDNHL